MTSQRTFSILSIEDLVEIKDIVTKLENLPVINLIFFEILINMLKRGNSKEIPVKRTQY